MPIREYLLGQLTFDPEAITAMSRAFVDACADLQVFAGDKRGRDIIAARIIDLASRGLIDAQALRDRVVREARSAASVGGLAIRPQHDGHGRR